MNNLTTQFRNVLFLGIASTLSLTSCLREELAVTPDSSDHKIENFSSFKMHEFLIDGNKTYVKEKDGQFFYSECEIINETQFNTLKKLSNSSLSTSERATLMKSFTRLWPESTMYYTLDEISSSTKREKIKSALRELSNLTNIKFIERTNQANYAAFRDSDSNTSAVGMQKGKQTINLYNELATIIQHEVMHALGVHHEQCRSDRNNYIKYDESNVKPEYRSNFNLNFSFIPHGEFDFNSIMLYGSKDFAIDDSKNVLSKLNGASWVNPSHISTNKISQGDINGLKYLYGTRSSSVKVYPHAAYGGTPTQLYPGTYTYYDLINLGIKNDEISSVSLSPNMRITLFKDSYLNGAKVQLTQNSSNLANQNFNDETSSILVENLSDPNKSDVKVYQHSNYGGTTATLKPGGYTMSDLNKLGVKDNDISSIKVGTDLTVTLFDGNNFSGNRIVLSEDSYALSLKSFNDMTTSILIEIKKY